jgi:hypothetical protein
MRPVSSAAKGAPTKNNWLANKVATAIGALIQCFMLTVLSPYSFLLAAL